MHIAAVILAAGQSSRFGKLKQLIPFRGKTLLRGIMDAAAEANCSPIAVVLGSGREQIKNDLEKTNVLIVENRSWQQGVGTSIRAGVQHVIDRKRDVDAIVLLVCDQPFVDGRVIKKLIALPEKTRRPIIASSYGGTLGVPALFSPCCFHELLAINDTSGAKSVIVRNRQRVTEVIFPEGNIDIDTAEDYKRLKHLDDAAAT
jgi:molybdenum cofactor cytidylyltransferase